MAPSGVVRATMYSIGVELVLCGWETQNGLASWCGALRTSGDVVRVDRFVIILLDASIKVRCKVFMLEQAYGAGPGP